MKDWLCNPWSHATFHSHRRTQNRQQSPYQAWKLFRCFMVWLARSGIIVQHMKIDNKLAICNELLISWGQWRIQWTIMKFCERKHVQRKCRRRTEKLWMRNVCFWVKCSLVRSLDVAWTVMAQICEIWPLFPPIAVPKQQALWHPEGLLLFISQDPPNQTVWVTAGLSVFTMKGSFVSTVFGIYDCESTDTSYSPPEDGHV